MLRAFPEEDRHKCVGDFLDQVEEAERLFAGLDWAPTIARTTIARPTSVTSRCRENGGWSRAVLTCATSTGWSRPALSGRRPLAAAVVEAVYSISS